MGYNTVSGYGSGYGESSNLLTGLFGAIVGAVFGVIIWLMVHQAGGNLIIGQVAIALGTFIGYKLLGGILDVKGTIFSTIMVMFLLFVANYVSIIMEVNPELRRYDVATLIEIIKLIPSYLNSSVV